MGNKLVRYKKASEHLCKLKPTTEIYVLTSSASMCSLICNTVRWHRCERGGGCCGLWHASRPPHLAEPLFCLSSSLSSSFPSLSASSSSLPLSRHPQHPLSVFSVSCASGAGGVGGDTLMSRCSCEPFETTRSGSAFKLATLRSNKNIILRPSVPWRNMQCPPSFTLQY